MVKIAFGPHFSLKGSGLGELGFMRIPALVLPVTSVLTRCERYRGNAQSSVLPESNPWMMMEVYLQRAESQACHVCNRARHEVLFEETWRLRRVRRWRKWSFKSNLYGVFYNSQTLAKDWSCAMFLSPPQSFQLFPCVEMAMFASAVYVYILNVEI